MAKGSSSEIESRSPQRYFVDSQVRCSLERPSREIPILLNLPQTVSILGAIWNSSHYIRNTCQRSVRTWQVRSLRMLYRRDLYGGEKRGFGIGKTKRGKGTKFMAMALVFLFNRKKLPTQNGRVLRRYARRWKIERLFAWLQNYRRLLLRHDYHLDNFLGFVHLACILILMRRYF